MGPLFAALALAILAALGFGVVFGVSLIFVRARRALRFALAAVPGAAGGAVLGAVFATVLLGGPRALGSEGDVLALLGTITLGGVLGMTTAIWLAANYRGQVPNP